MKLKEILLTAAMMAALLTPSVAQDDDDETPLAKEMYVINKPYKKLGRALRKGDIPFDELIPQVEAAIKAAKKSNGMVPMLLEKEADEAKKEASIKKFKELNATMEKQLEDLLVALKAKDAEKTQTAYDALKESKKEGHTEFIED